MKVKLLRDSRIMRKAGEIVEVSPEEAYFLLSVRSAEPVVETVAEEGPKKKPATKTKR